MQGHPALESQGSRRKGIYCTVHSPFLWVKNVVLQNDKMRERSCPRRRNIVSPLFWTDIGNELQCRPTTFVYFPLSWRAHLWSATRYLYFPVLPFSYIQSEELLKMEKYSPLVPKSLTPSLLLRALKSTNVGSCGRQRNKQHHLLTEHHQEQVTG